MLREEYPESSGFSGSDKMIEKLKEIIDNAENIVFLGGAGMSTESGIPDFRSSGGLYNSDTGDEYNVAPETLLSHGFMMTRKKDFYKFYKSKMIYPDAKPNEAHYALARLEEAGKLKAIITQNIDGLHQAAGSRRVLELHGTTDKYYCVKCHKFFNTEYIMETDDVPSCDACGGFVRPDVVMYGENLPGGPFYEAVAAVSMADVMIVGGTSLTVQPAASFVDIFQGEHLIIINRDPTPYDGRAELVIRESVSKVLSAVCG